MNLPQLLPTSGSTALIRLEWFPLSECVSNISVKWSCAASLPTHCHIVIEHVDGGDPGCHIGMISPHLFGFRNLSSVPVKASAKHRLHRSEADRRSTLTHASEMHGTKCSFRHAAKEKTSLCQQQLSAPVVHNLLVCDHFRSNWCTSCRLDMFWVLRGSTQNSSEIASFESAYNAEEVKSFSSLWGQHKSCCIYFWVNVDPVLTSPAVIIHFLSLHTWEVLTIWHEE